MKDGLSRSVTHYGEFNEATNVNVFDIETKKIVFTGSKHGASDFLGIRIGHLSASLKHKYKTKSKVDGKKYAIRIAPNQ